MCFVVPSVCLAYICSVLAPHCETEAQECLIHCSTSYKVATKRRRACYFCSEMSWARWLFSNMSPGIVALMQEQHMIRYSLLFHDDDADLAKRWLKGDVSTWPSRRIQKRLNSRAVASDEMAVVASIEVLYGDSIGA